LHITFYFGYFTTVKTLSIFTVMKNNFIAFKNRFIQLVLIIILLLLWELSVRQSSNTIIPSPSKCFIALYELVAEGVLLPDLFASLGRVSIGFTIALIVGLFMGFLLGLIPSIKQAVMGIIELLRPIPPIAWIPIAVSLLGIGNASAWFVIFIGAFFPILTNTLLGIRNIDKIHLEASKVLGASRFRSFKGIVWPSTLPSIFAGMRVGLGFAWMCVVAAEMFASRSGLGYEIQLNRQLFRLDRVVAGMIAIAVVGFLMSRFMTYLEYVFVPWRRGYIAKDFFESVSNMGTQLPALRNDPKNNRKNYKKQVKNIEKIDTGLLDWKPCTGISIMVKNLIFSYPSSEPILKGINLEVKPGEIFCVLGLSGCGKSTLLRLLSGLEKNYSGSIIIEGKEFKGYRDDVTMVFQDFSLFPWRNVKRNVQFAVEQRVKDKKRWEKEALQMLSLVGLQNKALDYPHFLSGGQMQRVAFARALACKPRLMLLDEPFSSLDSHTRETLQEEMAEIFKRSGVTVVMVTHDIAEAIYMADRIAVMTPNGGHFTNEFIIKASRPRDRKFRDSVEFRELVENLWLQINPKLNNKELQL
jgi:NitT/TauT family transport system ATP-binding protein